MSQMVIEDRFTQEVRRLREDYQKKRDETNLLSSAGRAIVDLSLDWMSGVVCYTYWYEHENDEKDLDGNDRGSQDQCQCIRLADKPGTLSGDILRLEKNLPASVLKGNYEIMGDQIRPLDTVPALPDPADDSEDLGPLLDPLPVVEPEPGKHFVKTGKYESEIRNLLKSQGGSCPGTPKSPNVIQLLGKSPDGKLVFEKFHPRYALAFLNPLKQHKAWVLQVISGLKTLHSLGIVHRDLRIDNLVFSADGSRVLIIDLESRWGNRLAPEVSREPTLDAGWTEKSDIYDLGHLINGMVYGNVPITNAVEWVVPSPLNAIVEACIHNDPEQRPGLNDLYIMVDEIEIL